MLVWTVKYKESRSTLISCRIELHEIFNRTGERLWTLRRDNWRFRIQLQRYIIESKRKVSRMYCECTREVPNLRRLRG